MDRNALAELLQALESRRDAEERRREERYTALIEREKRSIHYFQSSGLSARLIPESIRQSSILSEVTTHSRSKLPSGKNVFVMGEDGAGKTTLLARLQGIEEYMKGRGLEYLYFNVHDEDIDDHARCNAWILDGDLYHKGLQKFALSASNIRDTLAVLVVDMARPWTVLDSLQKWSSVFREYIDKLKIPPEEIKEMEHRLLRQFQEYTDPGEDLGTPQRRNTSLQEEEDETVVLPLVLRQFQEYTDPGEDLGTPQRRNTSLQEEEDETVVLPLGENTLTHNLGVPLLVICTKFVHEKEIIAEDDQVFLIKLQSLLAKQPPVAAGRPVDASNRVPGSPRTPNRSGTTNVASVTPIPAGTKKIDPNMKAGTTSEGVLANFFNSLLSKKTGSPGSGGSAPGGGGGNLSGSAKKSGLAVVIFVEIHIPFRLFKKMKIPHSIIKLCPGPNQNLLKTQNLLANHKLQNRMDAPGVYGNTTEPVPSKRWLTDDHADIKRVVIKILEVLLSFVAFICEEVVNNCSDCGALYFFEFVSCTAFLFTILLLILLKTTLFKSVGINHLPYVDFIFTLGIAVFFLIASCVFAANNYGTTLESTAITKRRPVYGPHEVRAAAGLSSVA
ncbi:UNVERIFIED_CONTAM: hypothetical protein FKN15_066721 [Acipenser sinensis]